MSSVSVQELYETLEKTILLGNSGADMTRIRTAFDYANTAHADQKRRDGSPYITHTLSAAIITAEMGLERIPSLPRCFTTVLKIQRSHMMRSLKNSVPLWPTS